MKNLTKIFCIIFLSISFSCSHKKKEEEKSTPQKAYRDAMKMIDKKNYTSAAQAFEKITDEFPFSKWAVKGQTIRVYALYKESDYEKLIQACDDFLRSNPASEYAPYVMYMKALAYYETIPDIQRAQDQTKQASVTFRELIARFRSSDYATEALEKLSFIDEHLAGHEMSIGRYKINNKNYVGAVGNFSEVVKRYRATYQVPEALFRLTEIYYKIGLKDESTKIIGELKTKFPENFWTKLALQIDEKEVNE